jgi:hypothetical protein
MSRLRRSTTAETTIIPRSLKAPKRTDSITSRHPLCPTLLLSSKGYQKPTSPRVGYKKGHNQGKQQTMSRTSMEKVAVPVNNKSDEDVYVRQIGKNDHER